VFLAGTLPPAPSADAQTTGTEHADPAADLPCAVLALGATFIVQGPSGERRIDAGDFFRGYFQTAVGEDEILVEVRVPRVGSAGWGYEKFINRANDWAIVAVAVVDGRVALANMGETPLRATATEQALASGAGPADAALSAAEGTAPIEAGLPGGGFMIAGMPVPVILPTQLSLGDLLPPWPSTHMSRCPSWPDGAGLAPESSTMA
jgi:hypothetical protein